MESMLDILINTEDPLEESKKDLLYKRVYDSKWNFKEYSMKELVHGLHPYPAMMMHHIARTMFEYYGKGKDTLFMDPYVGSGTTLVEAQYYGVKKAIGIDLNPLAILLSKAKTLDIDLNSVHYYIDLFDKMTIKNVKVPNFTIRDSWFNKKTIEDLAKIKAFIDTINNETVAIFFKVAFSEVVRASSKTRNGEFKLYRMSHKSLENFDPNAIEMFRNVIRRNYTILQSIDYKRTTEIELYNDNTIDFLQKSKFNEKIDLIITSPPYGDSHTTVAYGQFSRLSNEWLGIEDACTLDKRLLGGKKVADRNFGIPELDNAIQSIKNNDKDFNRDRAWEVVAFYHDYENSIKAIAPTVKHGGYVIYVVGNRRVRNIELPLDIITYKMFEHFGFEHIITHVRDILNKRMPSKASPENSKGGQIPTMTKEYIVVMRKK